MIVREIAVDDIDSFILLAGQLGYEINRDHVKRRVLGGKESEIVYVVESDSNVVGWIDCKMSQSYMLEPYCEIAGLVVEENERSKGIGKQLLLAAEAWAREHGTRKMLVRSNVKRERAHNFYLGNGYQITKQSMVFNKLL